MTRKFYRVENSPINLNQVYQSKNYQYGRNLDFSYYQHFLNVYFNVMRQVDIPSDFFVSLNNRIFTESNPYRLYLNDLIADEEYVELYAVTNNINHSGFKIPVSLISDFINNFKGNQQFIFFDKGIYLWEFILEAVRLNWYSHLPKRLESVFLFDDLKSCQYYIKEHLNNVGTIYEVELIQVVKMFEGDMMLIDNVQNHILFLDLMTQMNDYWKGVHTQDPIREIIFQGSYLYTRIIK
ncbi:hypothetical protein Flavo103_27090 [Flavobacterium collinsii]|uniref:DUF2441 domain-containing protein n=1 Tax=Flavobacterium collinsii TaxID=1114861 RepID=UPI0022C57C59|nr:DUF2441 domain-containing protein [Flavobacterium collinsii]GIQ59573.1 hypothetical protein Flavo103_27090 [Flavobacterium collinsii]